MSNNKQIIDDLAQAGAILKGHFILSSGLHSDTYVQCAQIFAQPEKAQYFCKQIVEKILSKYQKSDFDLVVAPAMGGVIIGYEIARQLCVPNIFCERVNSKFTLRRGFQIKQGQKILIVEDVVTTGKSSIETAECIKEFGGEIVAEACLINRSGKEKPLGDIPLVSLIDLEIASYKQGELPEHLQNTEAVKPGSRFLHQLTDNR